MEFTAPNAQKLTFDRKNYSDATLLKLYESLLVPRRIEEKMLILLRQGRISKWFSGWGQESNSKLWKSFRCSFLIILKLIYPKNYCSGKPKIKWVLICVADPEPYVFGPPGSGSIRSVVWIRILIASRKNSKEKPG